MRWMAPSPTTSRRNRPSTMDMDATLWVTLAGSSFTFWGLTAAGAKLLIYISSLLAVGLMVFRLALPIGDAGLERSLLWVAATAAIIAVLASALRVMVQAGRLMGDVAFMTDWQIIAISLEGPLGTSTYVRMAGLALLLLAILVLRVRVPATVLGAVLVTGSFALTGHATRDPQWLLAVLITVHLLAVSFWIGALLPLYRLASSTQGPSNGAAIAHRFGVQASFVVPVLMAVGVVFAWLLLGGPAALFGTAYGQMLLIKLAIVAVVLGVAALNKLRLVPDLAVGKEHAAASLRTALRWEALVFLAIFSVTAILTTSFTVPTP